MNHMTIKNIALIAGFAIGIACLVLFAIAPNIEQFKKVQINLAEAQTELVLAEEKTSSLKILERDKEAINRSEEMLYEYLPADADSSGFVVKLEGMAKSLSIPGTIPSLSVNPQEETKSKDKKTDFTTYNLTFKTDYQKIQSFIEKLEEFPRLTTIDVLSLSGYDKDTNYINALLKGKIYYGE